MSIPEKVAKVKEELSKLHSSSFQESLLENDIKLEDISQSNRPALVQELYNMGVDWTGPSSINRSLIGDLCAYWIEKDRITKQDYECGLTEFLNILVDLVIDVPKVYEYTAAMIGNLFFTRIFCN